VSPDQITQTKADGGHPLPVTVRASANHQRLTFPVIVHSRADIASLLRSHRLASRETCEAFDARAGFSDRSVTKLEHGPRRPDGSGQHSGKVGFHITPPSPSAPDGDIRSSFMADVWLETAGVALVLMPADLAKAIGAVPAPKREAVTA
jgi:hypothetical protein